MAATFNPEFDGPSSAGVISGYRATFDLTRLGYGIRAIMRIGRADCARVVKLIQTTPECINARK